jgi:formylglycine-generating enzyme required for sulfatase activity
MAGNVWEWTDDWWSTSARVEAGGCCGERRAPSERDSVDARAPGPPVPRKVVKGGSFLCADEYCLRYRPAARSAQAEDTAMTHIGFRCAWDVPEG